MENFNVFKRNHKLIRSCFTSITNDKSSDLKHVLYRADHARKEKS